MVTLNDGMRLVDSMQMSTRRLWYYKVDSVGRRYKLARKFFFFSSRRRHTRLTCDWSSDVCSSDLDGLVQENLVGDDLGLEASGFEFVGDVEGGGVVLG